MVYVSDGGGAILKGLLRSLLASGVQHRIRYKRAITKATISRRRSSFPLTAFEVHRQMSDVDFEYLAAAVIMVLEGYRFERRCGGRGDQGVDAILINHSGQRVVIQAKCYALHRSIGSGKLREFVGGMRMYDAAKGYFVTTSTFTPDAMQVVRSNGFIRPINGGQLEMYLQQHADHIEKTYNAIRSSATS